MFAYEYSYVIATVSPSTTSYGVLRSYSVLVGIVAVALPVFVSALFFVAAGTLLIIAIFTVRLLILPLPLEIALIV